jgi:hypothetical protein
MACKRSDGSLAEGRSTSRPVCRKHRCPTCCSTSGAGSARAAARADRAGIGRRAPGPAGAAAPPAAQAPARLNSSLNRRRERPPGSPSGAAACQRGSTQRRRAGPGDGGDHRLPLLALAVVVAVGPGRGQPGGCAFADQVTLELSQGGKYWKTSLPPGGGGVDRLLQAAKPDSPVTAARGVDRRSAKNAAAPHRAIARSAPPGAAAPLPRGGRGLRCRISFFRRSPCPGYGPGSSGRSRAWSELPPCGCVPG